MEVLSGSCTVQCFRFFFPLFLLGGAAATICFMLSRESKGGGRPSCEAF